MKTYRVGTGDTLNEIAKFYEIPLNRLLAVNPQIVGRNKIFVTVILRFSGLPTLGQPLEACSRYIAGSRNARRV